MYYVTAIEMGCECCSYVTVAAYENKEEIPDRYLNGSNYEIEWEDE